MIDFDMSIKADDGPSVANPPHADKVKLSGSTACACCSEHALAGEVVEEEEEEVVGGV